MLQVSDDKLFKLQRSMLRLKKRRATRKRRQLCRKSVRTRRAKSHENRAIAYEQKIKTLINERRTPRSRRPSARRTAGATWNRQMRALSNFRRRGGARRRARAREPLHTCARAHVRLIRRTRNFESRAAIDEPQKMRTQHSTSTIAQQNSGKQRASYASRLLDADALDVFSRRRRRRRQRQAALATLIKRAARALAIINAMAAEQQEPRAV